jgi:hypothetical protein
MGAFLAMMKRSHIRATLVALVVMALGACSNIGPSPMVETFRTIGTQKASRDPAVRDARGVLTPSLIATIKQPYLLVEIPSRQASATRVLFNQRGPVQDWRGEDGISVILQNDILIGTRGLGPDLFAADPLSAEVLRSGRAATYTRVYRHLDSENHVVSQSYSCSIETGGSAQVDLIARQVATRRTIETCRTADKVNAPVINEFWTGISDGLMWKSRQWVGPSVEYATFYHLVR